MSFKNIGIERENMMDSHHACTINTSWAADLYLATDREGRFVGNRIKQLQSDVVDRKQSPRSLSPARSERRLRVETLNFCFNQQEPAT